MLFKYHDKSSTLNSTHYATLHPQNGDRIVDIDWPGKISLPIKIFTRLLCIFRFRVRCRKWHFRLSLFGRKLQHQLYFLRFRPKLTLHFRQEWDAQLHRNVSRAATVVLLANLFTAEFKPFKTLDFQRSKIIDFVFGRRSLTFCFQ